MNELQSGNAIDFLNAIAADTPTPGGGSVAAYVGAMAVSLVLMSIRISMKRKVFRTLPEEEQANVRANVAIVELAHEAFLQYYEEDIQAYATFMAGLPYANQEAKEAKLTRCLEVPYELAEFTIRTGYEALALEPYISPMIRSDYTLAYSLWSVVLQASASNIRANLASLSNPALHQRVQIMLEETLPAAQQTFRAKGESV